MPAQVGDILQLTDEQSYLGQQILNVWYYRVDVLGSAADYEDIADAFETNIILPMLGFQNTSLAHTRITIKNLTNELDIYEQPISQVGSVANDPLPSFMALSFRLVRSTALTRHGRKSIAGLYDNLVSGNEVVPAGLTQMSDFADIIGAPLVVESAGDEDIELMPVIIGRVEDPPDSGNYRLDLSVVNPVAGAQFIRVSSMTTRRVGRGS